MKGKKQQRRTERYPNTCEPLLSIKETAREVEVAVSEYKTREQKRMEILALVECKDCKGRLKP